VKRLKEVVSHARFSFHCISLIFFVDGVLLWLVVFLDRFLMAPSKRNPRKSTRSQPSTSSPIPTPTPPHLRHNLSSYDDTIHPDLSCYYLFADTHFKRSNHSECEIRLSELERTCVPSLFQSRE
jgi:hypothetical protein